MKTAMRVRFPEVDPRAEPIVFVVTGLKGFAFQQPLANLPVTAVIAENECGSKPMQRLTIVLGQFAVLVVDADLDQFG